MYYEPFKLSAPFVVLIIGLLIMIVGGFVTTLIKDEYKSETWFSVVEVVGGIVNIAAVVMLIV